MIQSVELNHYCAGCGNMLETETKLSTKKYNEVRVEVSVCKTCERNAAFELIQTALKSGAPVAAAAPAKKVKAVKAKKSGDAKPYAGKKRGRPAKVKEPVDAANDLL